MRRLLEVLAGRGLLAALQAIPHAARVRLGEAMAWAAFRLDGRHRQRALDHLSLVYGERRAAELAPRVFSHVGRHVAEFARVLRGATADVRVENAGALHDAVRRGRGVVVVSAHLGSFTLLGLLPRRLGVPAAVVLKRQKNERLRDWASGLLRRRFGVEVVLKPDAPARAGPLLREGKALVLFADQHPISGGFPARFFSRPVEAATGPAVLAKRYGAPLLVATVADSDSAYRVRFDGPVPTDGTLEEVSQRWLDILEARIREHPDQWMWMHRRFRSPLRKRLAEERGL